MRKNLRLEDLGDFLDQPKCATLATHFKDGTILMSPVWHEWKDGGFTVAVASEDIKARHVRRDARVSISVAEDSPPYRGIEVRGEASIERAGALRQPSGSLRAIWEPSRDRPMLSPSARPTWC